MGKQLRQGLLSLTAVLSLAPCAPAQMYGVSSVDNTVTFCQINTTTGAATALFSYETIGAGNTYGLAYNLNTKKFLTVQIVSSTLSHLVEIDPLAQSASVVSSQIPSQFFEGLEYYSALGGMVVSFGNNNLTGRLALLDDSYNLVAANHNTGLRDGDILFTDGNGALNCLDANDPTGGFQRNRFVDPFGTSSLSGVGSNMFSAVNDEDLAWKADEDKLFITNETVLGIVNPDSTSITAVGPFGIGPGGVPFKITGLAARGNEIQPNGFIVSSGFITSGDLSNLFASDDDCLGIFPSEQTFVAEVEVSGVSPLLNPTLLTFTAELSVARPGLSQTVRLRNFATSTLDFVDGRVAPTSDTTIQVTITTNAANYVAANCDVSARIRWEPINDEDPAQDGWLHCIDVVHWSVE